MRKILITFLFVFPVFCFTQQNQEKEIRENSFSVGLFYNYNLVYHKPDFWYMNIYSNCSTKNFEKGINDGYNFGVCGTIPIGESFRGFISASYSDLKINLNNSEQIPYNKSNTISYLRVYNGIEGNIISFNMQVLLGYKIYKTLFLSAGFSADFQSDISVMKNSYTNLSNEKIIDYVHQFSDKRILYFLPLINLSYDFFIGNKDYGIILSPNVQYEFGLYNFLTKTDWKYNVLGFGISLRYTDNIYKFQEY